MKRLVVIVSSLSLALLLTACAPQPSGSPEGDALHSMVPSVIGLDQDAARSVLEEAGYFVGEVTVDTSVDAEPGTVVEQEPIGSTSVPRESEIDLVVAGP